MSFALHAVPSGYLDMVLYYLINGLMFVPNDFIIQRMYI